MQASLEIFRSKFYSLFLLLYNITMPIIRIIFPPHLGYSRPTIRVIKS